VTQCYRRFSHPVYLLTCELETGHKGEHKDGQYGWAAADGFDDEYTGAPIKYDADRVRPESVYVPPAPEVETLEESAKRAPKFYKGVTKVEADKDGAFPAGSLSGLAKGNKTIAERLAERKVLNASLSKTDSK
jgi:hypothetical protein